MALEGIGISSSLATQISVQNPATSRGAVVLLGKATSVNMNSVAQTTIFTTPAVGGFTRCRVTKIVVGNISAVCTTASFSFGQGGTPTDWAATATYAGLTAVGKFVVIIPSSANGSVEITATGINFVINVTIGQGVATTADVEAFGAYE